MTGTDATLLAISIKHALKHLREGHPDLASAVLQDAQDIMPRDEPLDPMRGVEFPFAENH